MICIKKRTVSSRDCPFFDFAAPTVFMVRARKGRLVQGCTTCAHLIPSRRDTVLLVHIWYHLAAIRYYLCTFDTISLQYCTTCAHLIPSRRNIALLVHTWYHPHCKMVLLVDTWYHPHRDMVLPVYTWYHLAAIRYYLCTFDTISSHTQSRPRKVMPRSEDDQSRP